jgi:6-pyruvoyl-tetrahydropterin synthase
MSHLNIDIKEVDNRLKKILNSYDFKYVEDVKLLIFSATSLT